MARLKRLLDKYYDVDDSWNKEEKIIFGIYSDISDRGGLDSELDGIDDETKEEMLQEWLDIVKTNLPG